MPRLMSFALTERQLMDGTKTVTRRLGWLPLVAAVKIDTVPLIAVRKAMGLGPGGKIVRLREINVIGAMREPLSAMLEDDEEAAREGFPNMSSAEFVRMFCEHMRGATPETVVTRIEFSPGTILLPGVQ